MAEQLNFLPAVTHAYRPNLGKVRARLQRIFADLDSSAELDPARASLYRQIVPGLTLHLPDEEGRAARLRFYDAMKRRGQ